MPNVMAALPNTIEGGRGCAPFFIIIIIYLLRPWAAHKTYKDKKLKTTGTHTNRKR